ncbi:cyclic nucleotide-binding domain-containing protein [Bacteroides caecigallinarum]|nr:cyclic nucleotide-binding domain-containing protein [Bacteroides caecigallinarum]
MTFPNIIKSIKSYYPVSDESINQLIEHFTVHYFPAKHLIIRGSIIDRNVYFIEKGLTRSYCLVDGDEHTTWFSKEGDITFGLLCLYHNKAGFEFVETLEPTIAYSIPINILNKLNETNIEIANWSRVIHQECLLTLQCVRIDNLTMTAKERYNVLTFFHG